MPRTAAMASLRRAVCGLAAMRGTPAATNSSPEPAWETGRLYPRTWVHVQGGHAATARVSRGGDSSHVLPGGLASAAGGTVRLCQFNVLADGLCGMDPDKGGFTDSPLGSLDWEYRRGLLIEEILRHGKAPDIVAMEEVDHYHDWFEPIMRGLGYEGRFLPKPNSPCQRSLDPTLVDGCAVFWHTAAAQLLDIHEMCYNWLDFDGMPTGKLGNQVALLVTLQLDTEVPPLVVAVTHLLASKDATGERCRRQQVQQLLDLVRGKALPCVVATDMNATPCRDGPAGYSPEAYRQALSEGSLRLRSAYAEVLGEEPSFTTWKRRGDKETKHTIDYILVSESVEVLGVLAPPQDETIETERLPSWRYPSDHIALMADLRLLPRACSANL